MFKILFCLGLWKNEELPDVQADYMFWGSNLPTFIESEQESKHQSHFNWFYIVKSFNRVWTAKTENSAQQITTVHLHRRLWETPKCGLQEAMLDPTWKLKGLSNQDDKAAHCPFDLIFSTESATTQKHWWTKPWIMISGEKHSIKPICRRYQFNGRKGR